LTGVYVTTEASIPVIQAARDTGVIDRIMFVTTDLFPELVHEIRSGTVAATIYQRPRTQGVMAFRVLHEFLIDGIVETPQVTIAPHLVMRGNLDYFLQRQSFEGTTKDELGGGEAGTIERTYSIG